MLGHSGQLLDEAVAGGSGPPHRSAQLGGRPAASKAERRAGRDGVGLAGASVTSRDWVLGSNRGVATTRPHGHHGSERRFHDLGEGPGGCRGRRERAGPRSDRVPCPGPAGGDTRVGIAVGVPVAWHREGCLARLERSAAHHVRRCVALDSQQYRVTQQDATEPPYRSEFSDHQRPGSTSTSCRAKRCSPRSTSTTVDTGWPSFTVPVAPGNVVERADHGHGMVHVEVRSAEGDKPSRSRLLRRSRRRRWPALLHQLGRPALRPRRRPPHRGVRRLPRAVRALGGESLIPLVSVASSPDLHVRSSVRASRRRTDVGRGYEVARDNASASASRPTLA